MRAGWGVRGALAAAVVACGIGFMALVAGFGWLARPVLAVLLVSLAMAIVAAVARGRAWPMLAGAVASVLAVTGLFSAGSALLAIVPTPRAIGDLVSTVRAGGESIANQTIPARPDEGIVLLVTLGLLGLALALEFILVVARLPALIAVPLLVVSAAPNLIDPSTVQVVLFLVLVVLYAAVLLAVRPGTRRTGVVIAATALAASLVAALVLPPVEAPATNPLGTGAYSIGANPIVDVRNDLHRPSPITAFTYTTSSSTLPYFTLAVLDDFDGDDWGPDDFVRGGDDVLSIGAAPDRPSDASVISTEAHVAMGDIRGQLLPVPWAPRRVSGLAGAWAWDAQTLAVRTGTSNTAGQRFTVVSDISDPSVQQLEAAGTSVPGSLERFTSLPADTPAVIGETARSVVNAAGATSFYDMAVALQAYFQGPEFTYSTEAPVAQGYDGSSTGVIAQFLSAKSGYCVHFSSAMALMARSLGIPARLGVGFTAGTGTGDAGSGLRGYTVSSSDMHAWPELYFEGVGWQRFEPTPGIGSAPPIRANSTSDPTDGPSATPTSTGAAAPVPSSTSTRTSTAALPQDDPTSDGSSTAMSTAALRSLLAGGAIVLLVLILLFGPGIVRAIRRARRLSAVASGRVLPAWDEVRDTARDLGIPPPETHSARTTATALAVRLDEEAQAALSRLLTAVERHSYARGGATAAAADVRVVRRGLARSMPAAVRVRALLWPRSFVRR